MKCRDRLEKSKKNIITRASHVTRFYRIFEMLKMSKYSVFKSFASELLKRETNHQPSATRKETCLFDHSSMITPNIHLDYSRKVAREKNARDPASDCCFTWSRHLPNLPVNCSKSKKIIKHFPCRCRRSRCLRVS